MKKYILLAWARLYGVHLVKFYWGNKHGSNLGLALHHPLEQINQNVAVLYPKDFISLEDNAILKAVETKEVDRRKPRNKFWKYFALIHEAAMKLRKFNAKK